MNFSNGLIVPLLTPFNCDLSIDKIAFKSNIARLMNKGVRNFFVLSKFGEQEFLDLEKEREVIKIAHENIKKNDNFFVGCFSQSTQEIISKINFAQKYTNNCVINVPYLALTNEVEFVEFFDEIFTKTKVNIFILNDPVVFKRNIPIVGLNRIANWERFIGVFDFSKNPVYFSAISDYHQSFHIFQGVEELAVESFNRKCTGLVLAAANVVPEYFLNIKNDFYNNGYNYLIRDELKILTLMRDNFVDKKIQLYKKILSEEGIMQEYFSNELAPLSNSELELAQSFVEKVFS